MYFYFIYVISYIFVYIYMCVLRWIVIVDHFGNTLWPIRPAWVVRDSTRFVTMPSVSQTLEVLVSWFASCFVLSPSISMDHIRPLWP